MSQDDFQIGNLPVPGGVFRGALNAALQALASLSSGPTAPATTYGGQLWLDTADTSNPVLKLRNAANTAWINLFTIGASGITLDAVNLLRGGSQVYSRNNILGTVAQSAGVPTGAIIERGSNANGSYVRYASGEQICWHGISGSTSGAATWIFPAAFVGGSSPNVLGTPVITTLALRTFLIAAPSNTSVEFNVLDGSAARTSTSVRVQAIGRWF